MKCSKCNKEIRSSFMLSEKLTPPQFSTKNWNLYFCDIKCRNEWEDSECGKNYDLKRLEKLDEYLEKCRNEYKWSGGEPEDGEWLKRPSDEVYNFEKDEEIWIEEAKKIRQKWDIKEEQPQEREREREREIPQLRTEIQHLEQITNRTAEQERELQEKKQRLVELERDKQQEGNPKPTNWIPWIIGGIILVLVVGIIVYFWRKNKEK